MSTRWNGEIQAASHESLRELEAERGSKTHDLNALRLTDYVNAGGGT